MTRTFHLTCEDLIIPCKMTEPDYGEISRVVLGVHGLGGSMEDDIQCAISEEMDLFSSATVRFDFPAHGESPMNSDFFTLRNCVNSLCTVACWIRDRYPDIDDLCIFASGYGAYVTLIALPELMDLPGKIKLVIQTPSVRMDKTLLAMMNISKTTLWAMDRVTIRAARPFDITYRFYEELIENSAMNAYPIPMLILHSESNQYIDIEDIRNFHRINEASKLVIVPGTQHRFLEPGAWDMALDLTRDWFDFEQVLLEDWT